MNKSEMTDITDSSQDLHRSRKIEGKVSRLRSILGPVEEYVIMLQRILVWEQPYVSLLLLVAVNLIFWLATTWCLFSLIGVTGMVIVALEMFASYAWPAVEESTNSSDAEWTVVHPHLMSVPELARALAEWWQRVDEVLEDVTKTRASNRAKFFVSSVFILSTLAVVGIYVPGFYILYTTVMGVLLWPAIRHHALIERISAHVKPVGDRVERTLNIKRKHHSKRERDRRRRQGNDTTATAEDDSDSDEGIEDFIPSISPSLSTALRRATMNETVNTEEENDRSLASGRLTPPQSSFFSQSRDHSDDDLLSDDYLPHFARGLGNEMPSIEGVDTMGSIHQFTAGLGDLMPSIDQYDGGKSRNDVDSSLIDYGNLSAELDAMLDRTEDDEAEDLPKMDFFPSHYRETLPDDNVKKEAEEDEEEALSQGLSFDELSEALEATGSGGQSNVIEAIGDMLGQGRSTIMSAISSSTVTTLMTSTAVGFSAVRDKVSSTINTAMAAGRAKPSIGSVDEEEEKTGERVEEREGKIEEVVPKAEVKTEEASDLLDAEFEFLDREELDAESV